MFLVLVVLASLSLSCGHSGSSHHGLSHCAVLDTMMADVRDVDSLTAMVNDYHKQGDAEG